jgi:hypothetical protein
MSDDSINKLFDKVNAMAIDISSIKTTLEADDKLCHEARLRELENTVNQWTGSKVLLLWMITTGIAIFAALKH